MARKIKLLLADDHPLVREGIRSSLERCPFVNVVGEAATGKDALRKTIQLAPDVVLMDLNMPEMSGIEATPLILQQCPATRVLALTVHDSKEYVARMLKSGASGYVLKDTSPEELVQAIQSIYRGEAFFSPRVSRILLQSFQAAPPAADPPKHTLSQRELQVLESIAKGQTSKEIAQALNLSVRTVETYRVRVKRKLGVRNTAELIQRARELNLL